MTNCIWTPDCDCDDCYRARFLVSLPIVDDWTPPATKRPSPGGYLPGDGSAEEIHSLADTILGEPEELGKVRLANLCHVVSQKEFVAPAPSTGEVRS